MNKYLTKIEELTPESRKILLHIIRELAKIQLPLLVKEQGLEGTEEIILEGLKENILRLYWNKTTMTYWLEKNV